MSLNCRGYHLPLGERTLIMGILNVTPDSFSDGGRYNDPQKALDHALEMEIEGADIIDVGAESTRPGHTPVSAEEEKRRLFPVLELLLAKVKVPISIDTYKAEVAKEALEMGAHLVNDVWGFRKDSLMPQVVAIYPDVPVIVMHNKDNTNYQDLMGEIASFLLESKKMAMEAGIGEERIIFDPGIGFGKNLEQNLEIMCRLKELKELGQPLLLGTSNKSMIGKILDLPVEERTEGTAATLAIGIANGADIIRVHKVKEMLRVAKVTDAIIRGC